MTTPRKSSRSLRPLSDAQLYAATDEELVRYIAAAKRTEQLDHARSAMHILLFKHERRIRRRVGLRLPEHLAHHEELVAGWVLERIMQSALRLGFAGESVGEWVSWWGTAVDCQVVSFFRSVQGQALERELATETEPESLCSAPDPADMVTRICHAGIVDAVTARMENPMHLAVVRAAFWDDLPSAEIAAAHGTSVANVDQIKSRFRRELRAECERRGVTGE